VGRKRDEVNVFWAECRANHLDGEFRLVSLAGEDVDVGVAGTIAKMAGDPIAG
jgi:hypothetical protein